jgi:hypothetical protein
LIFSDAITLSLAIDYAITPLARPLRHSDAITAADAASDIVIRH